MQLLSDLLSAESATILVIVDDVYCKQPILLIPACTQSVWEKIANCNKSEKPLSIKAYRV